MGLEDLKRRYDEMDYVDRQNFWMAVVGAVVVLILLYHLTGSLDLWNSVMENNTNVTP